MRAWTIQQGTKAPQAAGKIHTDFERGFIMAEVMSFDDYKELGSEAAVKVIIVPNCNINCHKRAPYWVCESQLFSCNPPKRPAVNFNFLFYFVIFIRL